MAIRIRNTMSYALAINHSRNGVEIWKAIPEYVGYYEVSNLGRVRSIARTVPDTQWGTRTLKGKIRALTASGRLGHVVVTLVMFGEKKTYYVHQLVMLAFCGPMPPWMDETRHLNGKVSDNKLFNLKYGTYFDNQKDRILHGTTNRGERCGTSKLTFNEVAEIKLRLKNRKRGDLVKIAKDYGVTQQLIGKIALGKIWQHS